MFLINRAWQQNQYREWERTRNLEFTMYNVQYSAMSGKKMFKTVKKPQDLYKLPTDHEELRKVPKQDKNRQAAALENMKSTMQYKEWQTKI